MSAKQRTRYEEWWICTEFFTNGGTKVLGPFVSQDLALIVRSYVEKVEGHERYFVDSQQVAVQEAASR